MFVDSAGDFASTTFDFVIIGGGTAGLALAAKLTEDKDLTVGVIEAGSNRIADPNILVPGLVFQAEGNPNYDWAFTTVPQKFANNRSIFVPRGKVLGGSSAINGMVATYPSREDINHWRDLGNPGWGFDDLAPYHRHSTGFDAPSKQISQFYQTEDIIDPDVHKIEGPVRTSFPATRKAGGDAWIQTWDSLGLKMTVDPQTGGGLGGFSNLRTIDGASSTRSYAAIAYYAPNIGRSNLTVLTEAQVSKITFLTKKNSTHATGVSFVCKGSNYHVKAGKEVILCAGAIQSPQILELSGIGSKEILTPLGIDVIVENPNVGENLQDQPFAAISFQVIDGVATFDSLFSVAGAEQAALTQFYSSQSGVLNGLINSWAYLSHDQLLAQDPTSKRPDLKAQPAPVPGQYQIPSLKKQHEIQIATLNDPNDTTVEYAMVPEGVPLGGATLSTATGSFFNIGTVLAHEFSRGASHITSSDPTAKPAIDYRYLSHPLDLKVLEDALLFIQSFVTKPPFSDLLLDGGKAFFPGFFELTRDNIDTFIREAVSTSDHPIATCSMMPKEDGGVVDTKLKVYGVENLRVVDASIFPLMTRNNPSTTVYAVAEKDADIINAEYSELRVGNGALHAARKRGADKTEDGVAGKKSRRS